ncbi:MAG: DUF721 domain-containing protein [Planctomycetota bacterium]|nr:DUF721 domain-containing protein [Planctomycetota bacterium]
MKKKSGKRGGRGKFILLSAVIPKLFKKVGIATGRNRDIQNAWREVAGEEISVSTRVVGFRAGVIIVEVNQASLLSELTIYYKKDFLKLLRERLPFGVNNLKFKVANPRDDNFLEDRENPPPPYKY